MEEIQTEVQRVFGQKLTRLEVLRELDKRGGLSCDKKLQEEYLRLKKGVEGEQILVNYLRKYGQPHWKFLRNVWFDFYGEFEIDLLLITGGGLYNFEVKNYSGNLELVNSQCRINGHSVGQNPFSQAQKASVQLKEMLKQQAHSPNIQEVLLFIGENNQVDVQDQVSGLRVLCRNELMHFIWQIARQERNYLGYPVEVDTVLAALSPYEIGKPSKEKEVPQKAKEHLRKGVCCCHCGSFDVKTKNRYVICSCGMHEPKTEAILRTICEYGIIYHEKNLTTTGLTDFFDGFITRKTILRYLNKYFERVGSYKGAEYLNKKKSLADVCQNFDLKESKYLKIR